MKTYVKTYQLWEADNIFPEMRLPNNIKLTPDEVNQVKNLDWSSLDWKEAGNDSNNIIWLEATKPFNQKVNSGIIVDIQLIGDSIYQMHINLAKPLQNMGLGLKIYRSVVDWAGHLYSGRGRRHNTFVNNIWKNLKEVEGVTCLSSKLGDICISNKNPDKEFLENIFTRLGN